jgi:hypothetical protein
VTSKSNNQTTPDETSVVTACIWGVVTSGMDVVTEWNGVAKIKNNSRRDGCYDCLGMGCCNTSGMDVVTEWNGEAIIK